MIRRLIVIALFSFSLLACQSAPPKQQHTEQATHQPWSGGDGSSQQHAVIISARNEEEGADAEHLWADANMPGGREVSQSLIRENDRMYDSVVLKRESGETRQVYFDITSFFGKW